MVEKHLSDVINYEQDIEPYRVIQIYSGVGSGKNFWVGELVKQGKSVLLITSRQNTADAQADKLDGIRHINFETLAETECQNNEPKVVVVTNSGIEKFLKGKYDPNNYKTHIWNYFDLIILDEAHSLVADASFADSPFHVTCFLRHVIHSTDKCKVIFMSGTPEPIQHMFSQTTKESGNYNYIDKYDECIHVDPKHIKLMPSQAVEYVIKEFYKHDLRMIYFANSIRRMEKLSGQLESIGIPQSAIGIAYSGDEERDFAEDIQKSKNKIKESLCNTELIPPEIRILLTTSQNKEGVNIKDPDIQLMFAEKTDHASLVQMAGRVRNGLDGFLILYDAPQHEPKTNDIDIEIDRWCLKRIQEFWDNYNFDKTNEDIIKAVENRFPSIRFDYLSEKFRFYSGRKHAFEMIEEDQKYMDSAIRKYLDMADPKYDVDGNIVELSGWQMLDKWFPNSEVDVLQEVAGEEQLKIFRKRFDEFLNTINHTEIMDKSAKESFVKQIAEFVKEQTGYCNFDTMGIKFSEKQPNRFLNKLGYKITEVGGHHGGGKYKIETFEDEL